MKIFLKLSVILLAVLLIIGSDAPAAHAYDIGDSFGGAPDSMDTWVGEYGSTCSNDYWSDGSNICDAYGFTATDYNVTAVRVYNVQCDDEDALQVYFLFKIRLNSNGSVLATSDTQQVNCTATPPTGAYNSPYYDLALDQAVQLDLGTTYALSWEVIDGYESVRAWGPSDNTNLGWTELYGSGVADPAVSITWTNPTQGATLPGYPTHFNFGIHTDTAFCGYVTGYASSTQYGSAQGGTEGSCFPVGTTTYNYHTPGTAATGTILGKIKIEDGDLQLFTSSTISFSVQTTQSYTTGGGIGPTFPTPSSSLISIDCSAFDFWDSIDVFGAGTIPWPNVADWFPGTACYAKSAATDVLTWAFSVRPETTARFQALSVSDRAPFAYFYDIEDLFATSTATSTNAFPALVVHMPNFATASSTGISFTAFSSSTITTYVRSENITLFRNLMTWVLWLLFLGNVYFVARTSFNKQHTE